MRLLNTTTLKLNEIIGSKLPPYAILSHTWGKEEVLFQDIEAGTGSSKAGWSKITGCCKKAREDGYDWVWIDTCCIDKSSSAELSEAINSMYAWYRKSDLCYAYLQDITIEGGQLSCDIHYFHDFHRSRWFARGWTLQELIAPSSVEFYTAEWTEIGTKHILSSKLTTITRIPETIIRGGDPLTCNIAERMSWAAERHTTREEDRAYCLLGIFNINMPLLYGEGPKAFLRLQTEIMKQEEDYTLFAWAKPSARTFYPELPELSDPKPEGTGFLAVDPGSFSTKERKHQTLSLKALSQIEASFFGDKLREGPEGSTTSKESMEMPSFLEYRKASALLRTSAMDDSQFHPRQPAHVTSRGLSMVLHLKKRAGFKLALAWIYCWTQEGNAICVLLEQTRPGSNVYRRFMYSRLFQLDMSFLGEMTPTQIYLQPADLNTHTYQNRWSLRYCPTRYMACHGKEGSWPTPKLTGSYPHTTTMISGQDPRIHIEFWARGGESGILRLELNRPCFSTKDVSSRIWGVVGFIVNSKGSLVWSKRMDWFAEEHGPPSLHSSGGVDTWRDDGLSTQGVHKIPGAQNVGEEHLFVMVAKRRPPTNQEYNGSYSASFQIVKAEDAKPWVQLHLKGNMALTPGNMSVSEHVDNDWGPDGKVTTTYLIPYL